jgi:hypothetical protein
MILWGQVGQNVQSVGSNPPIRQGRLSDVIVSELHGKFYEQNYNNNLFTAVGVSNTALVAANAIATGLTATAQPVIGIYNPAGSQVNLSIIKAYLTVSAIANTAVAPGGFMWCVSSSNAAPLTLGSIPYNCKTLVQGGSSAKTFSVSQALTGLSNPLVAIRASEITTALNAAGAATAVSIPQGQSVEYLDGAFIVPPGGVLALMNQVSTVTMSVSTGLLWEEVAL